MSGMAHSMGHENWPWLALIVLGAYLMFTAKKRRVRVEPVAGTASVA